MLVFMFKWGLEPFGCSVLGKEPEVAFIRACQVSYYHSYVSKSKKDDVNYGWQQIKVIITTGKHSVKWPVWRQFRESVGLITSPQPEPYLISITTTDADLCHIPDVSVIASLAPHFGLGPSKTLNIDIKCSNCTAVHVVPELQAWALGSWVPWTQQTSLGTLL